MGSTGNCGGVQSDADGIKATHTYFQVEIISYFYSVIQRDKTYKRSGLQTAQRLIINFNFKLRWMAVEHRKHTFQYKHMHSDGV